MKRIMILIMMIVAIGMSACDKTDTTPGKLSDFVLGKWTAPLPDDSQLTMVAEFTQTNEYQLIIIEQGDSLVLSYKNYSVDDATNQITIEDPFEEEETYITFDVGWNYTTNQMKWTEVTEDTDKAVIVWRRTD